MTSETKVRAVEQCPAQLDLERYGLTAADAGPYGLFRWDLGHTTRCVLPVGHEGRVDAVFHEVRLLGPGFPDAISIRWLTPPPGTPEDIWQARNRPSEGVTGDE